MLSCCQQDTGGTYRGPAGSKLIFREHLFDMAAKDLQIDRVNSGGAVNRESEMLAARNSHRSSKTETNNGDYRAGGSLLEVGWTTKQARKVNLSWPLCGIGVSYLEGGSGPQCDTCRSDGAVSVYVVVAMGQNETIFAQIAADALEWSLAPSGVFTARRFMQAAATLLQLAFHCHGRLGYCCRCGEFSLCTPCYGGKAPQLYAGRNLACRGQGARTKWRCDRFRGAFS
jgi:hypothetical protein